ncbi:MAG: HAD hydrolase family protein [Erysipelotrichaceae bacterium]|nr:HAD hydrolase family protein [Erysipelotrichaceae bacterium]
MRAYRLSLDVIVVGDSENDVVMFANAKHSYCMTTAESQVLAQAAQSTTSVAALI